MGKSHFRWTNFRGAGHSTTTGYGNTFVGDEAGRYNTTGVANTFVGFTSGVLNTTGHDNTFVGDWAGERNTTGNYNAFFGAHTGDGNTTGVGNSFFGVAGANNQTGSANVFLGFGSGDMNTAGMDNVYVGVDAGFYGNGNWNTIIGSKAGFQISTGSNNIVIGENAGPAADESATIRIGNADQVATYIAGIYGSTSSGGVPVYINSGGLLGTLTSSRRFKEQIADMGESSSGLMQLRPVTYFYKPKYDKGPRTLQYGLIAEEVADVYPELVAYEPDGKPYTVKYQYLTTMLLNEVQKQYRRAEAEAKVIEQQEQQIEDLQKRLERLEALAAQGLLARAK